MTFPTEAEHATAIKALLTAVTARPYEYGETPAASATAYSIVSVTDRFGGAARMTSQLGTRSVRVTILAVGTTVANARLVRQRADAALREKRVTVGGLLSTPIAFETSEAIGKDGDTNTTGTWYSGLSSYTYTV